MTLLNFKIGVMNVIDTKTYELTHDKKVPVIKISLCREGLQLIKTFTNEEKHARLQRTIFCVKPNVQAISK